MKNKKQLDFMMPSSEKDFEVWWYNEGSGMFKMPEEDAETHCYRVSKIAWLNGAYKSYKK